jgi:hypothetical protein
LIPFGKKVEEVVMNLKSRHVPFLSFFLFLLLLLSLLLFLFLVWWEGCDGLSHTSNARLLFLVPIKKEGLQVVIIPEIVSKC